MWTFINEMTHPQPECRPTMAEIVTRLERFSLELDPDHAFAEDRPDEGEMETERSLDVRDEDAVLPTRQTPNEKSGQVAPSKGILKHTAVREAVATIRHDILVSCI